MTTVIDPTELFFGAPVSLTVGGTEVGGTVDIPKITITPTIYSPDFQNAAGPIKDSDIITKILVAADVTVNQFTAAKIAWAMAGATTVAGTTTWKGGRIPSTAYKDVIMVGVGLDGREMTFTIKDAIANGPLEIDLGNTAIAGLKIHFEGRFGSTTPMLAPFTLVFSGGS